MYREMNAANVAEPMERIFHVLNRRGSVVNRGLRQQLYLHRSCQPLDVIDFEALASDTLDPMTTGECLGVCGV